MWPSVEKQEKALLWRKESCMSESFKRIKSGIQ